MAIISKFIVNRNNFRYIYVEKYSIPEGCEYFVYDDNNSSICSAEYFQSMFGIDQKISIEDFLILAETNLISTYIEDETIPVMYNNFNKILSKIRNKNKKNPSLWGYTNTFFKTINLYNDFVLKELKEYTNDYEPDYEEEYQRLIKQEQ